MSVVRATSVVPRPLATVERAWYDLRAWPAFVDGFAQVVAVGGDWPRAGTTLTWDSTPRGRGRVVERVLEQAPGRGQSNAVSDRQLSGTQTVSFAAEPDGAVRVTLELDYRLAGGRLAQLLRLPVDVLFVRGALAASLQRTLARFEEELLR